MLIITRGIGSAFYIGDDIVVRILGKNKNHKGQIRIGIEAPEDINIVRSELVPEREISPTKPFNKDIDAVRVDMKNKNKSELYNELASLGLSESEITSIIKTLKEAKNIKKESKNFNK